MRVAFFTDTYLPNVDGVVSTISSLKKQFEKKGNEVFIFSPGSKKQKESNKDDHVHYFTSTSFKPYPDYRIALFNFFSPVKLVKERKIEIIHSHGIATTGLAAIKTSQKLGIPAFATFHTLVPEAVHYITKEERIKDILSKAAWKYLIWYYSHFKKVFVPSMFVKEMLEKRGLKNTILLPNGIDTRKFSEKNADPGLIRKKFKIPKSYPVVAHVGRVALEKGIDLLIESAPSILNIMPKSVFLIVGKGPGENYYKDLVAKKGLEKHFIFTGYVSENLLLSAYATADALVFPSTFDTQGLTVLEAMGMGTPAVVRKNSAPSEMIEEGVDGYIFSDHFDFYEKVVNAVKNKKKIKENVIKKARKYDIRDVSQNLLEMYEKYR